MQVNAKSFKGFNFSAFSTDLDVKYHLVGRIRTFSVMHTFDGFVWNDCLTVMYTFKFNNFDLNMNSRFYDFDETIC